MKSTSKTELKKLYKNEFEKVRELVNDFDPCGLIYSGFPEDEYDCLTSHLLSAVHANKSREEITNTILHKIEFHFGTPDSTLLIEPYKTQFYKDIETLIDKLGNLGKK